MKIILIPSSVLGSPEPHQFLSSAVVNDVIAIDGGCLGFFRSAQEQARVRHVLLSHTHMDHLASLPLFVDVLTGFVQPRDRGFPVHERSLEALLA